MTEDFLHYVWRTKQFQFLNLKSTDGQPIEILDFGQWNHDAGPDFSMARISIDETLWIGHVEIHLCASDWNKHGHTADPAYGNVVLHVVLEHDTDVFCGNRKIPCLELRHKIDPNLLARYLRLMSSGGHWVPCEQQLSGVSALTRNHWLDRMCLERLDLRSSVVTDLLDQTQYNWEVTFYRTLAAAFGFKTNAVAFGRLAQIIPLKIVYAHRENQLQLEALFFGVAGFLNKIFYDVYPAGLQREFEHLKHKYSLPVMNVHEWKWGRMRPANFPSYRIAQFALIASRIGELLQDILSLTSVGKIPGHFDVSLNLYWKGHSNFDRECKPVTRSIGESSVRGILINCVAPFIYTYGRIREDDRYIERAMELLQSLPGEQNHITRGWARVSMPNTNAGLSQGLIHLKRAYCDTRRCMECAIGNQIMSSLS